MGRQKVYKIGKSNDPQGRLASLQSASPYKLKLYHTFRAENASAAEETLHVVFHSNRLEGEWFQLSDEQKKAVMTVVEFKEGQFHTDKGRVTAEGLAETK